MRATTFAIVLGSAVGVSVLLTGSANAAREVTYYVVSLDPWTKQACLQEVEELQNRLTGRAGDGIVTAMADEAEENCNAGRLAEAQRDMNEAYRKMSHYKGSPASP